MLISVNKYEQIITEAGELMAERPGHPRHGRVRSSRDRDLCCGVAELAGTENHDLLTEKERR